MKKLGYSPELVGVRGAAILLVAAAHILVPATGWFTSGLLGVDVFFVLSGFLITTLLLEEWDRDRGISLRGFYWRRARRLLPALVALLVIVAAVTLALHPESYLYVLGAFATRLTYLSNLLIVTGLWSGGSEFTHLWSLAQEEQFYLVWPPLLFWLLRRGVSTRTFLLVLGGAFAAVNIDLVVSLHLTPNRVWMSPDTHGGPILLGCFAAIIRHRLAWRPRIGAGPVAAAVVVLMIAYYELNHAGVSPLPAALTYPIVSPVLAAGCAVLILSVVEHQQTRIAWLFRTRLLRAAGLISYSWYLWNTVTIWAFGPWVGGPLAIGVAAVSYKMVEQPFLRRRTRRVASDPIGVPLVSHQIL